jgi:hypothetical protein
MKAPIVACIAVLVVLGLWVPGWLDAVLGRIVNSLGF